MQPFRFRNDVSSATRVNPAQYTSQAPPGLLAGAFRHSVDRRFPRQPKFSLGPLRSLATGIGGDGIRMRVFEGVFRCVKKSTAPMLYVKDRWRAYADPQLMRTLCVRRWGVIAADSEGTNARRDRKDTDVLTQCRSVSYIRNTHGRRKQVRRHRAACL